MAATFNKPGFEIFNNHTFVIMGDGCLQEGVASETASLAGYVLSIHNVYLQSFFFFWLTF